jgi:acyl-CoA synthetase (AMP-forming)/AMP-acid ligase II
VLLSRGGARDPNGLLSAIAENRITCLLGVVPSLLNELSAAAARPGRPPTCLRLIMTTGEALRSGELERAQAAFPEVRQFVNQYGPSEATMIATHYPVVAGRGRTGTGTVLIGRPIPNVRTYVLDRSLEPSPIGIPGEVFVGGVGVAPGYLNRPQETAERFLPDPFSGRPGDRLYRTGDRACLHDDGNLEFVGRVDLQVKIRGNRVELGEVENVLAEHASVRQAAVTAVDDPQGPTRLVAYVVPEPGDEVHPGTLRRFLQDRLPDFMIPSAFVAMQAMPLTPNGKVDRRSLPPPGADRPALETAYAPPRTVAERKLAEIWCALLGLQNIGIQDGFLELGGHSLLTVRAIALMRQAFGVEVDLKWFFEPDATVERMAARIEEMQRRRQS